MTTNTYQRFYSSSDVQVVISNLGETKFLTLDLSTGVGFSESQNIIPVYTLNKTVPSFFVKGTSIVTGFIGLAFKYEQYLKKAIEYVNNIETTKDSNSKEIKTFKDIELAIEERTKTETFASASIAEIISPFNLSIIMTTDTVDSEYQAIKLYECYLGGRTFSTSIDGESTLSEGFSIIAKMII